MSEKRPFWHDLVAERPTPAVPARTAKPPVSTPKPSDERTFGKNVSDCLDVLMDSAWTLEVLIKQCADDDAFLAQRPKADRITAKMAKLNKLTLTIDRFFFSVDTLTALVGNSLPKTYTNLSESVDFEHATPSTIKTRRLNKLAIFMGIDTKKYPNEMALRLELEKVIARFGVERFKTVSASIIEDAKEPAAVEVFQHPTAVSPAPIAEQASTAPVKTLPEKADELYKGRKDTSEDGPAFYNRVYKDYIGNGLTRAVLDKLDHPLVARIDALKRKGDAAALALDLPTAWIAPQKWADRVLSGEEAAPKVADEKTHRRNRARLTSARERVGKSI